jgi:biotin synthase
LLHNPSVRFDPNTLKNIFLENLMQNWTQYIHELEEKILAQTDITTAEARTLLDLPAQYIPHLGAAADNIRITFKGNAFDACSLINARSGRCSEDCAFCAQSGHYNTECEEYELKSGDEILAAAELAKSFGAGRFCTVTSGGALSEAEFYELLESLMRVKSQVAINLDVSLGFISDQKIRDLIAAGVTRYNHNLEASKEYFSQICTTHAFEDRVKTVKAVLTGGLSACSGGIIGMGETPAQRVDMAFTLREIGVDCVPINILNARPGTPLADSEPVSPMEIIKTIAVFRMILPKATIKVAGGREKNLRDFQGMALRSGANGMIVGGYLTTAGRSTDDDLKMIEDAGYELPNKN